MVYVNIERVSSPRVLGVIVNDQLSAADHVTNVLRRATVSCTLENSPLPWYPRRVTAKCLSSDGHREVNVLCNSVVRCMFRRLLTLTFRRRV